jgi:HEAT repeat protein
MEELQASLSHEDSAVRLEAVSRFSLVEGPKETLFKQVSEDFNHEVREAAANVLDLCPSMFSLFLGDPDIAVRLATIRNSLTVRQASGDSRSIISTIAASAHDPSAEVRRAIATVIHQHADLPSRDDFKPIVVDIIVPLLGNLIKDVHDDVRVAAALNLRELVMKFGFDIIFELLNTSLHSMLTDNQWRVRNTAVELMFQLALVCSSEFFNEELFPFLLSFLQDPASQVREYAVKELPKLVQHFGDDWFKTALMAELQKLAESPNCLPRQTYLPCISELIGFFPVQYQANYVLQPMIRMLKDPVHGVVLKALQLIHKHQDTIHPFQRQYELVPILKALADAAPAPQGQGLSGTIREKALDLTRVS